MFILDFKKRFLHIAAILLGAFIFSTLAFYNGFPFTFNNDTGVYINSGFSGEIRPDRPIIYGLFMAFVSLHYSLWLVLLVQALIVSLVVYYVFRYASPNSRFLFYYIGFVGFVSFFMGASFEVAWLMPDVFIAVAILCIALLVFFKLKVRDVVIVSSVIVLSIIVHNSHFYICILLSCLLLSGYIFKRVRLLYAEAGISLKKIFLVIVLAVFSNFLSATIHHHYGGGFKSSYGGAIFFMSNLVEMGVIDPYLAENCEKEKYKLCAYKDSIPNDFLWAKNSPMKKTGGWGSANETEYFSIGINILTTPKYCSRVIYKSVIYTVKQFFNYDLAHAGIPSTMVEREVKTNFPDDYKSFINSRQSTGRLQFNYLNFLQDIAVGISGCFFFLICFFARPAQKLLVFAFFIISALVINAWLCSAFSGVYPRYQSRVVWLLPLPMFIYALQYIDLITDKLSFLKRKRKFSTGKSGHEVSVK